MLFKPNRKVEVLIKVDTSWLIACIFSGIVMSMTIAALTGKHVTTSFGNFKVEVNSTRACRVPEVPFKTEVLMADNS